jgi:hypothetical protein
MQVRTLARLGKTVVAVLALVAVATGCSVIGEEDADPPRDIQSPCPLLTESLLERLAPGADTPEPNENLPETSGTGYLGCAVDLTTAPPGGFRGDLTIQVWVDNVETFDEDWQRDRCAELDTEVTTAGPGDTGCVVVQEDDGQESRVDGYAYVGSDYEVSVHYQLISPDELPESAEDDVRALLYAGIEDLPEGARD